MNEELKIVTYNVNGLRPRISQFGSLRKLLDALDADIICFQETKLSKLELRADLVRADGYESFFSCNRCYEKGRAAYSGVATFCRVKSAFSTDEVALPVDAQDGFTGLLENCIGFGSQKDDCHSFMQGFEDFSRDEMLRVDGEGRCVVTDHGHFVIFNIYGPRAGADDAERAQFKLTFFQILQKRWESLLRKGRRILVVGDLNIAPSAIDRCDAAPDFEKDKFRKWFRSLLLQNGGQFFDIFRAKHPERKDAYTCWSTNTGAEEFNFGSRIDHILGAGSCLHEVPGEEGHDFITCHVKECEILTQFKRCKPGNSLRWKAGRSVKLEGSDHAPVCVSLFGIPSIQKHSTPSLSTRYSPQVYGNQQTLLSMLTKKQLTEKVEVCGGSTSYTADSPKKIKVETPVSSVESRKKARQTHGSQLSLTAYFTRSTSICESLDAGECVSESFDVGECVSDVSPSSQLESKSDIHQPLGKERTISALMEWQRIQQVMQNSIPSCKGHKEPCVVRIVKKAGPNMGRRFYVCARAEGPASNPEANCGYFKWAASKSKQHK